jgi:cyclopropane-fatty-acyl-phospholipid synthase
MSFASALRLVDRGLVPDPLIRVGIRKLLRERLESERRNAIPPDAWIERLRREPVSSEPEAAKAQHYEVPSRFFELVLGPRLKYSSGYWPAGVDTLAASEEAMLGLAASRAGLADGQRILDLGCGWGSIALWMAERFPASEIEALSHSRSQGEWIAREAARRGLPNVRHRLADVGSLELDGGFDRVVSVEMFEHMRNYETLLERISRWLRPDGELFVHIFCHRELAYTFEDSGPDDWMARHFFTGGLMPAYDLLPRFDRHLACQERWLVDGTHYQRTCEAWLANLDRHRPEIEALFERTYGAGQGSTWVERWRVFFLACAELFGFAGGSEWQVAHYRFGKT